MPRTFGLIPAAGKSSRMGRPKLTLPLGGLTVLECVLAALKKAGIQSLLVVVDPHDREIAPLARAAGAQALTLAAETPDMQATVRAGLDWLEEHDHPGPDDDWLLLPADHPSLDPQVIQVLVQERTAHPEASIFIPTFEGRRGHPTLIRWQHVASLRSWPDGLGLNRFFRQHSEQVRECPVSSADILLDLDTPEDYQRLLGK